MAHESILITMSREDLQEVIMSSLEAHERQRSNKDDEFKTLSINQAAKLMKISHANTKKLIEQGKIKATVDKRRVLKISIKDYLNK